MTDRRYSHLNTIDRIAQLMSDGLDDYAIAERMGIHRKTVQARISVIRKRLGPQAS